MDRYESIKKIGMAARGRSEIIKHIDGKRLTQRQAILAKCYDCSGYFADGKLDCKMPHCPIYPWMPYKGVPESKAKHDQD